MQSYSGHNCLVAAAARLFNMTPEEVEKRLGHNGKEVQWPDAPEPENQRGIHIQELQDMAISMGWCLYLIETVPILGCRPTNEKLNIFGSPGCFLRFTNQIEGRSGLLIGLKQHRNRQVGHALYWDGEKATDIDGTIFCLCNSGFHCSEAWLLGSI